MKKLIAIVFMLGCSAVSSIKVEPPNDAGSCPEDTSCTVSPTGANGICQSGQCIGVAPLTCQFQEVGQQPIRVVGCDELDHPDGLEGYVEEDPGVYMPTGSFYDLYLGWETSSFVDFKTPICSGKATEKALPCTAGDPCTALLLGPLAELRSGTCQ